MSSIQITCLTRLGRLFQLFNSTRTRISINLCYFQFMSYQFSFVVHFGYKYRNVSVTFTVIGVDRWLTRCRWISSISIINSSWHHQMQLIFRMERGISNGDIDFQLSRNYCRFKCHKNTSFRLRSIEQTFQSPQCAWLHLQF